MITTLLELSTTKEWMMHPPILNAIRMAMQENIAGHVVLSAEQVAKHQAYAVSMNANGEKVRVLPPQHSQSVKRLIFRITQH